MTAEENKALVRGYMEQVISGGNMAAFDDYFAPDVVFNARPGVREMFDRLFGQTRQVFPDLSLTIEDQIAEGDRVVTRVTFRGTHKGSFQGLPPTGKQVVWTGVGIDRIADGRVVEMWHWSDDLSMLRQLGVPVG